MRSSQWKSREELHLSRVRLFEIEIESSIGIRTKAETETKTEAETPTAQSRRMCVCPWGVTQLSINRQTFVKPHETFTQG